MEVGKSYETQEIIVNIGLSRTRFILGLKVPLLSLRVSPSISEHLQSVFWISLM